jgi:hypothetical protein
VGGKESAGDADAMIARFLVCLMLLCQTVQAANNWYASPNGSPFGSGSTGSPFDLRTALTRTNSIVAGDTLWLYGGIYTTNIPQGYVAPPTANPNAGWLFKSYLRGSLANPIFVRSLSKTNIARIDGGASLPAYFYNAPERPVLMVGDPNESVWGTYNIFQDIEFYSSSTSSRLSGGNSDAPADIPRCDGPYNYGLGSGFVNCRFHDMTTGGSTWAQNVGGFFYGCLFWNNGWQGTPNAHGHNIYAQGRSAAGGLTKSITRNLFSYPYQLNIQHYGSSAAEISHFRTTQNGFIGTPDGSHGVVLLGTLNGGLANRLQDDQVTDNWSYGAGMEMYYHADANAYQDAVFANNYVANGYFHVSSWKSAVITNNTFLETVAGLTAVSLVTNGTFLPWNYDRNTYVLSGLTESAWRVEGLAPTGFTGWKALTGYEANSVLGTTLPVANYMVLLPNAYDPNRANLIVYNWTLAPNVTVSVASFGWAPGSNYTLTQSQDPLSDVVTGTVSGGSTITVNMLAAAHTVAIPYGDVVALGPTTFPRFGQFIIDVSAAVPPPPITNSVTLTVASSNPSSGVFIQMAGADINGASNGSTAFIRHPLTNSITMLTAPLRSAIGTTFQKWQRNGVDYENNLSTSFTNSANTTMTAIYLSLGPVPSATLPMISYRRGARQ